jgi:hypothetical protein
MRDKDLPAGYVLCECRLEGNCAPRSAGIVRDYECNCAIRNELARREGGFSDDAAKSLFAAILQRNWDDAQLPAPTMPKKEKGVAKSLHEKRMDDWHRNMRAWRGARNDARLLLTAKSGAWARAREVISSLAGLETDAVAERAKKGLF